MPRTANPPKRPRHRPGAIHIVLTPAEKAALERIRLSRGSEATITGTIRELIVLADRALPTT